MAGAIWVLAEHWRGEISELTFEGLALGREVADTLGAPLEAVLIGHNVQSLADSLGTADTVLSIDDPGLAEPTAGRTAALLAAAVREQSPRAVILPLSNISLSIGTWLAAHTGAGTVNFCRDLTVSDGQLLAECTLYGGKLEATVRVNAQPAVLAVWPGVRSADKGRSTKTPPRVDVNVTAIEMPLAKFARYLDPEPGDVDITQSEVLIAVGRGIQNEANLPPATELAELLGGAVCGSRPVIDQGWLPLSRQIGKSGLTVKPKAYLALGVSGAPEHVEGMRDSSFIIAVNSDAQAPIFNIAHIGVVADAMDIVDALTKAVQARRA